MAKGVRIIEVGLAIFSTVQQYTRKYHELVAVYHHECLGYYTCMYL